MKLNGTQIRRIQDALVSAYPRQQSNQFSVSGIWKNAPDTQTIGRSDIRKQIDTFVFAKDNPEKTFLTLHGPYGIGKTALMAEFFNELSESQSGFDKYWVDVDGVFASGEELIEQLASVLKPGASGLNSLDKLISELAQRRVCLVLDEVDWRGLPRIKQFLSRLQRGSKARILLTCLSKTNLPRELSIEAPSLTESDARLLLLNRIGSTASQCSVAELNAVDQVAKKIERLPALIEQIAQNAKTAPLENLPDILDQIGVYAGETGETNFLSAVKSTLNKLSSQERELIERVALFGSVVHSEDVTFIAQEPPKIQGEYELRHKIADLYLWRFDRDAKVIRLPIHVLKCLRDLSGADVVANRTIRRAAGKQLFQGARRKRANWLAGLQLLYSAQAWKQVLIYADSKFGVSENAAIFPEQNDEMLEARASWAIAFVHYRLGDSKQATQYAKKGIETLTTEDWLKTRILLIRLSTILTYEFFQEGKVDEALEHLLAVEALVEDLSEQQTNYIQPEIARIWMLRGIYETQRSDGNLSLAQDLTERAASTFEHLQDSVYQIKALSNLATIFYTRGMSEQSLQTSKQILGYSDRIEIPDTSLLAAEYCNVVDWYISAQDWASALKYAEEGARYCDEHGEFGVYVMLELNAAAADYALQDIEQLDVRMRRAEEYHDIVREQIVYEAMFGAGYARYAFLRAHQAQNEPDKRDDWLSQAREQIGRIANLQDAERNNQVQQILAELKKIDGHFASGGSQSNRN